MPSATDIFNQLVAANGHLTDIATKLDSVKASKNACHELQPIDRAHVVHQPGAVSQRSAERHDHLHSGEDREKHLRPGQSVLSADSATDDHPEEHHRVGGNVYVGAR